ncbi:PREDICTED: PHD finger protein 21B [Hipposideros armiger]|uniref:PHD finger protein 21B n=1 Tax=Hipposideros armiger TaxID=186990 RepID=A0A8B7S3N6_HIPAR|nr:PREDICTED: PHD finger protein 21B [Hipposideros armiger]
MSRNFYRETAGQQYIMSEESGSKITPAFVSIVLMGPSPQGQAPTPALPGRWWLCLFLGPVSAPPSPVFQALGTITAVPVTGPQVSSLQRLAGQGAAVLPQVRPKTLIPDSLPVTPGRDLPPKQPPTFQKATVVSIKNPSPALPTANNTVSHVPTPGSQPQALSEPAAITSSLSSAGVAYAIISTAPSNAAAIAPSTAVSVVSDSIKVQPLLISADNKRKRLASNYLNTPLFLTAREIQSKRQERKRRSTANPAYSGLLEPEACCPATEPQPHWALWTPVLIGAPPVPTNMSPPFFPVLANEDPCWKNEITHDEHCAACKRGANLQLCGTCPGAYHLSCLDPPLKTAPKGVWVCPKCQQKALKKDEGVPWTGMLAIVHSYVTHKTVKEEEKQKLLQRGSELQSERQQLEERDRRLASAVKKCLELKTSLLARQRGTQSSLDRLRTLLRLIQGEQMLQVTMTTTSPAPMLAGPWTKPSAAAMHSALQHPQGHN